MNVWNIITNLTVYNPIKTLYYSWKWGGIGCAFTFPVLIGYGCKFRIHKTAKVTIPKPCLSYTVRILKSTVTLTSDAEIIFNGKAVLGHGTSIFVFKGATLICGNEFSTNGNCVFNVAKRMTFGNYTMFSANALVYDTDLHSIYDINRKLINPSAEIKVGDNVWFGNRVTLLKGAVVGDNIVFGASSLITGEYLQNNAIYGGSPAKLLKQGITWDYEFPK